ncbi:hypothetical protein RP20_CCG024243 [Aedes albopictus]|nr:hypothetical protein RP20_CCG024243 [Aedes albopictus]
MTDDQIIDGRPGTLHDFPSLLLPVNRLASRRVDDLFEDLRDGHNLLSLLEVLSGEHLPREKGKMRFHMLQNAQMALDFLRYKKIKLVNIRAEDIVDGNPKLTLGLIWTIILHFQVSVVLLLIFCYLRCHPPPIGSPLLLFIDEREAFMNFAFVPWFQLVLALSVVFVQLFPRSTSTIDLAKMGILNVTAATSKTRLDHWPFWRNL